MLQRRRHTTWPHGPVVSPGELNWNEMHIPGSTSILGSQCHGYQLEEHCCCCCNDEPIRHCLYGGTKIPRRDEEIHQTLNLEEHVNVVTKRTHGVKTWKTWDWFMWHGKRRRLTYHQSYWRQTARILLAFGSASSTSGIWTSSQFRLWPNFYLDLMDAIAAAVR